MSLAVSPSSPRPSQLSLSNRSGKPADTIKTVVTAPPWAKHEPPTPTSSSTNVNTFSFLTPLSPIQQRPGHNPSASVNSLTSSTSPIGGPSWWNSFTLPLPRRKSSADPDQPGYRKSSVSIRERLDPRPRAQWLFDAIARDSSATADNNNASNNSQDTEDKGETSRPPMRVDIPQPSMPFTLAHNRTPGWDTPWSPGRRHVRIDSNANPESTATADASATTDVEAGDGDEARKRWSRRRKDCRAFMLHNTYVPLMIRMLNLAFTIASLVIGITIRRLESGNGIMGAIGSSPTLVIIFAPLTLVHVLSAIYLEYFGRPLGLWRTSHKLLHSISEVVFISAWSAALAVSFDNYFTTPIGCLPPSANSWWDPPPLLRAPISSDVPGIDLGRGVGGVADQLCVEQASLIAVVTLGLMLYGANLVVSLFRIFEKVKYSTTSASPWARR